MQFIALILAIMAAALGIGIPNDNASPEPVTQASVQVQAKGDPVSYCFARWEFVEGIGPFGDGAWSAYDRDSVLSSLDLRTVTQIQSATGWGFFVWDKEVFGPHLGLCFSKGIDQPIASLERIAVKTLFSYGTDIPDNLTLTDVLWEIMVARADPTGLTAIKGLTPTANGVKELWLEPHGLIKSERVSPRTLNLRLPFDLAMAYAPSEAPLLFPSAAILDNFNRANEGPPPSASWVNSLSQGLKVLNNTAVPDTSGDGSSWNTSFAANQEAFLDLATQVPGNGDSINLGVRLQTASDYLSDHYEVNARPAAGNDQYQVWKRAGGSWTQLGADIDLGGEVSTGDQIGIEANGTTITLYLNGASQGTRTDSSVSGTGYLTVAVEAPSGEAIDDFGGGAVVAGSRRIIFIGRLMPVGPEQPGVAWIRERAA